jgi:hypothetical protein
MNDFQKMLAAMQGPPKLRKLGKHQHRSLVTVIYRNRITKDDKGKIGGTVSLWFGGFQFETTKLFSQSMLYEAGIDPNDVPPEQFTPVRFYAVWHNSEKKNKEGNPYKEVDALEPADQLVTVADYDGTVRYVFTREGEQLYPDPRGPQPAPIKKKRRPVSSAPTSQGGPGVSGPAGPNVSARPSKAPQGAGNSKGKGNGQSTGNGKSKGNGGGNDKPAAPKDTGTPTEFWSSYNKLTREGALSHSFNPHEISREAEADAITWREACNQLQEAAAQYKKQKAAA